MADRVTSGAASACVPATHDAGVCAIRMRRPDPVSQAARPSSAYFAEAESKGSWQMRATKPRHPRFGEATFRFVLPLCTRYFAHQHAYRLASAFAAERLRAVRADLERGATVYLAGIACGGLHNSGVALVEVSAQHGPRLVCNHEEERFSGNK